MKAVILDGSEPENATTERIMESLLEALEAGGWVAERFPLARMEICHCRGCFGCWLQTPGLCLLEDDGQKLAAAVIGSELTVLFSPVTFGGYAAELKKGLDRLIALVSPFFMEVSGEIHHQRRYERYPGLWGVGVLTAPDQGGREIFPTLVERNAINFHAPGHAATLVAADLDERAIKKDFKFTLAELGEKL